MFQTLFLHSLLPARMLQMEDFLAGQTTIPMTSAGAGGSGAERDRAGAQGGGGGGGLLSALSSYLLSPYGSSQDNLAQVETSEDEVENTLVAVDCLGSCRVEELYGEIL
jgi:brefeldin A-resistance guanine nucleotide exchange factor 1